MIGSLVVRRATEISINRRRAAGLVKSPMISRSPQTVSTMPTKGALRPDYHVAAGAFVSRRRVLSIIDL